MLTKADLLAEMNRDMPACVDWKAGARAYVASCFEKYGREPIERYSMNKPFSLMSEGADPRAIIAESVGYLAISRMRLLSCSSEAVRVSSMSGAGWMGFSFAQQNGLFPHRRAFGGLQFGRGFFENENGYRWCGPVGEITARKSIENLRIRIFSNLLAHHRGQQVIKAYGSQGELARAVLTRLRKDREMVIGPLNTGEAVTLHASEAMRPSWVGSDDKRLLSFCLRTDD